MTKKAIILLSGGLDSATCLAIAKAEGFECHALSFHYGQKHNVEVEMAVKLAAHYGVSHQVVSLPLFNELGGSSLTDSTLDVPDFKDDAAIPNTYVPARNTIFLSCALAIAEVIGAQTIFIGANSIDYSNYPDCREDYLNAFSAMATLATRAGREGQPFKIHAPLLHLTKAGIIQKGIALNVDYGQTVSCYRADEKGAACGKCDSCTFRRKGFLEAGVADPTLYQ